LIAAVAVTAFNAPPNSWSPLEAAIKLAIYPIGLVVVPLTLAAIVAGRRPARWWYGVGGALLAVITILEAFRHLRSTAPAARPTAAFGAYVLLWLVVTAASCVASALAIQRNPKAGRWAIAGAVFFGGTVGAAASLAVGAFAILVVLTLGGL
jgi:hypothetical protein